ncbi:MAG: chromosome segregation protein SMC [Nitrososphaerota archaeon]|nr:chromosome segregation protein SMC [Nitrososphaerota archaeon]MDG7020890.1 chromosome segregation protein SMC [Nitrososphaerota archaeon]
MGYIRRLEVKGFKSFGPRALTITFEQGLNVVTGPNGSGKSNIADAILFALGENSPRVLRAAQGRLTGLIYDPKREAVEARRAAEGAEGGAGEGAARSFSPEDRPTSCKVSLQIDNADRKIPVDSDLVTLTRELKNNGENSYYLNGKKSTKSMIADFLEVSGLSPSGLNVIPQGAATRVADLTPDEKRKMIEDVVGISKFDDKKAEAQKQLSQADTKLQIELARTGEMKAQLERLEEQRNDLVRFNQLEGQLGWLKAVQTSRRITELRERLSSNKRMEEELTLKLDEVRKRKDEFEARVAAQTAEKEKFIVEIVQGGGEGPTKLRDELESVRLRRDQLTGEVQKREENIRRLEMETMPTMRAIVAERKKQVTAVGSTVESLSATLEKLEARRKEVSARLQEMLDAEETLRATVERNRKQADKVRSKLDQLSEELSPVGLEINAVQAGLGAEKKRAEELEARVKNFTELLDRLDSNSRQLMELQGQEAKELAEIDDDLSGLEKERNLIEQSIGAASRVLEKASGEVATQSAKAEFTEDLVSDRVGHGKLRALCEGGGVPGYLGMVNQLVSYPSQYSRACSAVMDTWSTAFVVADVRSMTSLIKAGKKLNIKSFAVIPLSEVADVRPVSVSRSAGVIGPLSAVLKADKQHRGLVNFIAGDTVLVESEGIAYILASEGFKTVTPDGETFELGGRAFAFGLRDALASVLEALEDIENVGEVQGAVKALRAAIDKRKQQMTALENDDRALTKDRVKKIAAVAALRAEAETVVRLSKRYRAMHRSINQDFEGQARAVERLQRREASLLLKREAMATEMKLLKDGLVEQESLGLDGHMAEIEGARNDLNLQLNELSSRVSEIHLSYTREKANFEQMVVPGLDRMRQDLEASEMQYEADRQFVQASRKELTELGHRFADLDAQLQKVLDSSSNSRPVLEEFDNKIRRLREEAAAAERSAFNTEKEIFALQQGAAALQDKVAEQLSSLKFYGYDDVLPLFDGSDQLLSQVEFEHEGLARTVNKSSERDYAAVYDSYRNLSQRINELEQERNSIVRFIESVDSEKRKVFGAAFATINNEFAGTFKTLTDGQAWLELENKEEMFTGGIYMMASFRGKPAWESSSMSGGEKSVTAVALILAIQKVNPHPFYLFDEIDQNLDQANSQSLASFFKERSSQAQIIVVSLKDTMVAGSGVAYGVYNVAGISRIVRAKMEVQVKSG